MRGLFFAILILFMRFDCVAGQSITNKGQDFWITFPPNYHNNYNSPTLRLRDSLQIYIVAETPIIGVISYRNRNGDVESASFSITNPGDFYIFRMPAIGYELEGFNNNGSLTNNSQNEQIAPQTFHITTDSDATVFALSQAETTSDAAMILPTVALGLNYTVMSYNSDGRVDYNNVLTGQSVPSQFAVVATEDNTRVTIRPAAATPRNSTANYQTVIMRKGDAYLVQAAITAKSLQSDLTGSEIVADKPVAVFGGQQRATAPIEETANLFSRDMLFEQIPPMDSWGKLHIISPFAPPANQNSIGSDFFRAVAGYDNTTITINGSQTRTLKKGQKFDFPISAPVVIRSSQPILIAAFKKSSGDAGSATKMGDPFMVVIPPREQYLPAYRFVNIQAYYPLNGIKNPDIAVYTEHYISVVIPRKSLNSLFIDGKPADTSNFTLVPASQSAGICSEISAGWIRVPSGAHFISANEPFGLIIYGYGSANSYGYIGGISLEQNVDVKPLKASGGKRICPGDSARLRAIGGQGAYIWRPTTGLSCSDCPNPIASPSQTTTYQVTSFDAGDCPMIDSVTVATSALTAYVSPDTTICLGGSARLIASGGVSYKWFPATSLSCDDCPDPIASPTASVKYIAAVTNRDGCTAYDSVMVFVSIPNADAGPDFSICRGDSARLDIKGGISYTWRPTAGLSCNDCPNPTASPSQTTTYIVRAADANGCAAEDTITITVYDIQSEIFYSKEICADESIQLAATYPGIKYHWFPPDGLSCDDCPNPVAKPTHSIFYTVEITNGDNCSSLEHTRVKLLECSPAQLNFGGIISCDNPKDKISFVNREDSAVTFLGFNPFVADSAYFTLEYSKPLPISLMPGDSVIITITFNPVANRTAKARYRILTSSDTTREFTADGSSYTIPVQFGIILPDTASPGSRTPFVLRGNSENWRDANIHAVRFKLAWKTEQFDYEPPTDSIIAGDAITISGNCELSREIIQRGDSTELSLVLSCANPLERDGNIVSGSIGVLLGEQERHGINLVADVGSRASCVDLESRGDSLRILSCALPIRYVKGEGIRYYLNISPTPSEAASAISINYGVGLTADAKIEIYSSTGARIAIIAAGTHKAGEYNVRIPSGFLSSGIYFCRIISGEFISAAPLIITN